MKINLTKDMLEINEFFKDLKFFYVGGCIRSLLLGETPKDYDLITPSTPDETIAYIKRKGKRTYLVGKRFGTIGVKIAGQIIEITTFRTEAYEEGSRKPKVVFTKDLQEDVARRDFTINSLVASNKGTIKDFYGGLSDIKNRILKCVGIPKHRFKEDSLRILRGIRFASKYNLEIEELTKKKMESCKWELYKISKERIVDEINKILVLEGVTSMNGLDLLFDLNIFQIIIPALHLQKDYNQNSPHHDYNLHNHTILTILNVRNDFDEPKYLWSALLHDIGKPFTQTLHKDGTRYNYINHDLLGSVMAEEICRNLKMSNEDRKFIVDAVLNHIQEDSWLRQYDNMSKKYPVFAND